MVRAIIFLALISVLCSTSAFADTKDNSSVPLAAQEQRNAADEFEGDVKAAIAMANSLTIKKKAQCMKAFGNVNFCACIAEKTPVAINFAQYISAVVATDNELQFNTLSPNDQQLISSTRKARDDCAIRQK